jgi:mycothiol synthase
MDPAAYSVRPFADADYEAQARIDLEVDPTLAYSAAEIRHWSETTAAMPGRLMYRIVAEERSSGSVVAYGSLAHGGSNFHPRKFWAHVGVGRPHRNHGIGSELFSLLEHQARARRALCLWATVRDDDPPSVAFLTRGGFAPQRKTWLSRLDLAAVDVTKLPDRSRRLNEQGIRLSTLQAEGATRLEVRRALYRLATLSAADIPRLGEYTPRTVEEFEAFDLDSPGSLHDATFVACKGDEFVGMSTLGRLQSRPDTLLVGYTGTDPQSRGLGIASELKRRAVLYAREHGYRFLVTHNDSRNRPIWAINEKFGFRQQVVWLQAEKVFASEDL